MFIMCGILIANSDYVHGRFVKDTVLGLENHPSMDYVLYKYFHIIQNKSK
jgi:hypothetical protein